MLPWRNADYCCQRRTSTYTTENSLLSLVQHRLCLRPSDEDVQQIQKNPYLQLCNFGINNVQIIFEISCANTDSVTNLTLNSQVQSSPRDCTKEERNSVLSNCLYSVTKGKTSYGLSSFYPCFPNEYLTIILKEKSSWGWNWKKIHLPSGFKIINNYEDTGSKR